MKIEFETAVGIGDVFYALSQYGEDILRTCCDGYLYRGARGIYLLSTHGMAFVLGVDAFLTYEEAREAIEKRKAERER